MEKTLKGKKWRQISIDEDRKPTSFENYPRFQELLNTVQLPAQNREIFPRPRQETPITSYGIICVYDSGDSYEYFCTQRRTTIEFGELVKCGPRKEFLFEYFSCMTPEERVLLQTIPHEKLWNDILVEEASLFEKTRESVSRIFAAYENVLPDLISLTETNAEEPPWEFPKGRSKQGDRTQLQTALREFAEEGGIKLSDVILMWDETVKDLCRGTDGQLYETIYFIIRATERYQPPPHICGSDNVFGNVAVSIDMNLNPPGFCRMPLTPQKLHDSVHPSTSSI